jgi:sugar (pentulose or hexulose) kinase
VDPPDDDVHEIVGWPWGGGFSQAPLCLLRRERPELFRPETFFCMNNDWIQWQLCGVRFLDCSSATPFYLQDQRTFRYCKKYLERVGVSEAQLSPLVPTGRVMGTLRESVAAGNLTTSTRLVSGSFDHPAAARACQITRPGDLLISCGTSWVGFFPVMERRIRPGTLFDPYLSPEGGPWGELVSLTGIGRELEAYIVQRYSTGPDRYRKFSEEAETGGPAADVMRETVRKFKALLPETPAGGKAILVGGPASSPSWRRIINRELKRDTAPSPFEKYAGAVGAAMIARRAMES